MPYFKTSFGEESKSCVLSNIYGVASPEYSLFCYLKNKINFLMRISDKKELVLEENLPYVKLEFKTLQEDRMFLTKSKFWTALNNCTKAGIIGIYKKNARVSYYCILNYTKDVVVAEQELNDVGDDKVAEPDRTKLIGLFDDLGDGGVNYETEDELDDTLVKPSKGKKPAQKKKVVIDVDLDSVDKFTVDQFKAYVKREFSSANLPTVGANSAKTNENLPKILKITDANTLRAAVKFVVSGEYVIPEKCTFGRTPPLVLTGWLNGVIVDMQKIKSKETSSEEFKKKYEINYTR